MCYLYILCTHTHSHSVYDSCIWDGFYIYESHTKYKYEYKVCEKNEYKYHLPMKKKDGRSWEGIE
jgi:hypothetical protein